MPNKDDLIGYNTLKKRIIDNEFCTLCGACEAACPVDAISVENEENRLLHDCSENVDVCPICYEVCPHTEALVLRALKSVSDAPIKTEALGYYRKIILAQSTDPKLRATSRGGGVVTALLTYGIKKKYFDSAIVSKGEPENPAKPKASVALVPDDILSAVGSKFFPSPVAKAYGSAVSCYGKTKIAFVGTPCHVLALRKIEAYQHKIGDNLEVTIGLFCFGTFSMSPLLQYLEDKYHIQPREIKNISITNDFMVQTANRTIRLPLSEVESHIMPGCRTCTDFTAELADISVGSSYPLVDWSTVIVRTKKGEQLLYDAVENGVINTWVIEQEPEVYERMIRSAMQKKSSALKEAKKLEEKIGYPPVFMLSESDIFAHVKVEDIMTKKIKTVKPDMTIAQLVNLMAKQRYGGYLVVQDDGEPMGIVTLEDTSQVSKDERDKTMVSQIIHRKPVSLLPGETALDALKLMKKYETGSVLVVDPTDCKKMLGMVTKTDLMHTLIE